MSRALTKHRQPRHGQPLVHLTSRDLDIIQMAAAFRGCSVSHILHRFWPSASARSACYRRIANLAAAGYLRVHRMPSMRSHGSGKALVLPGPEARRLLAQILDDDLAWSAGRKTLDASAFFAEHHFAVCDFRLALQQAAYSTHGVTLLEWIDESALKRRPFRVDDPTSNNATSKTITLIPDGAFQLEWDGRSQAAYLEMDMGTITHKRLGRRLRGYLLLNMSTMEPVPLFFVTTSQSRANMVVSTAKQQASSLGVDATTIFVGVMGDISKETILQGAIWCQAGVECPASLLGESVCQRLEGSHTSHAGGDLDNSKRVRSAS